MSAQSSKYHDGNVSPASNFHVPDYTTKKQCIKKYEKTIKQKYNICASFHICILSQECEDIIY